MRDVGLSHPADITHGPSSLGAPPALTHAPPPVAHRASPEEVGASLHLSAPSSPRAPGAPAPDSPQSASFVAGPSTALPASAMHPESLAKVAHILRLEELYSREPYPYNPSVRAQAAVAFLPQIAQQVGDAARFERLAQVVLHLEGRDNHPLSRLLMLYRLSLCPSELRDAIALFAPSLFRKLTSILERVALLNLLQGHVHGHDVEDFCKLVMLFGDAPTAYRGATPLYHAESIEKLVTLISNDTVTAKSTPALANAMDVAALGPVFWPHLDQALQILRSVDGILALPQGLSSWFVHNRQSADEWDRTAHRVAQTCLRLQLSLSGRGRLNPSQVGQRVFDFMEAFGASATLPDEDPVPLYTPARQTD